MSRALLIAVLALVVLAGCGGGGGSASSTQAATGRGSVVADVSDVGASIEGKDIVATARVRLGGRAGRRYTLRWSIVDAVSGVRASEAEPVAARYRTTADVEDHDVKVHARIPVGSTAYLVHFSLYGPTGKYVASKDSDIVELHS